MSNLGKSFPLNEDKLKSEIDESLAFIVRYTLQIVNDEFSGTADKTFSEILDALQKGKQVTAAIDVPEMSAIMQAGTIAYGEEQSAIQFTGNYVLRGWMLFYLVHTSEDEIYAFARPMS